MERNKLKLNSVSSQREVNEDMYQKISIGSDSKPLPYNDILKVISENDQFNKERKESTKYRLVGTVNSLFTNVLFNSTEERSWATFNTPLFRDRSYPPNGLSFNEEEDYSFEESIAAHLKEKNGWFGYNNPNVNEFNDYTFTFMEPSKEKFDLVIKSGEPNWGVTMVYPSDKFSNELTEGGLDIISLKSVTVGGKEMTAVGIPYKHNVKLGDDVKLTNIGKDGIYQVMRVGLDNGDLKNNYFVVDLDINTLENKGGKFKKIHYGKECEYYFRVFKRLKNQDGEELGDNDFDAYPLAFGKNIYNDNIIQMSTKRDVDIAELTDNLGRPISEVYFTLIKNNNKGFSDVKSGLLINDIDGLETYRDIPDIKRIHNGGNIPFESNKALNDSVLFSDDEFLGDLVEYNEGLLEETILAEVHHRFNTTNRELGGTISNPDGSRIISVPTKLGPDKFEPKNKPGEIRFEDEVIRTDDNRNRGFDDGMGEEQSYSTYNKSQESEDKQTSTMSSSGSFEYTRIELLYSKSWVDGICGLRNEEFFFHDGDEWSEATVLVLYYDGSGNASPGYYADYRTNIVRYWDGSKFTKTTDCKGSETNGCYSRKVSEGTATTPILSLGYHDFGRENDSGVYISYSLGSNGELEEDRTQGYSSTSHWRFNRRGELLDSGEYVTIPGVTTLHAYSNREEIRKLSDDFTIDGMSYTVYVKWVNINATVNDESGIPEVSGVYVVCNSTSPEEPTNPEPTAPTPTEPTPQENISTGTRQEGYFYKPFNKVQIRNFSNYIEQGDDFTVGIPDYAVKLDDGRYVWRDLLDIGVLENSVDYPFINGTHYLHANFTFALRRQDPFNERGLYYNGSVPDLIGIKMSNNKKINRSGDVC
jgi:hypothetical protein